MFVLFSYIVVIHLFIPILLRLASRKKSCHRCTAGQPLLPTLPPCWRELEAGAWRLVTGAVMLPAQLSGMTTWIQALGTYLYSKMESNENLNIKFKGAYWISSNSAYPILLSQYWTYPISHFIAEKVI